MVRVLLGPHKNNKSRFFRGFYFCKKNAFKNRSFSEKTITKMTAEMLTSEAPDLRIIFEAFFSNLRNNSEIIRLCLLLVIHPQTPTKVSAILENQKLELLELFSHLLENKFKENSKKEAEILLATIDGITIEYTTNMNLEYLQNIQKYLTKKYT